MNYVKYILSYKKGMLIFIAGFIMFSLLVFIIPTDMSVKPTDELRSEDFSGDMLSYYEFKDAVIYNEFAVLDNEDASKRIHFYIIGDYDDKTDSWVITTLGVTENQKIFETLKSYVYSSEMNSGELKLSFCTKATSFTGQSELQAIRNDYFFDAAKEFNESVLNGAGQNLSKYYFEYTFDTADEMESYDGFKDDVSLVNWARIGILGGSWFFVIIGLVALFRDAKRALK